MPLGLRSFFAGLLPVTPILAEPLGAWRYLAARPEIDPTRVGIAGHSGGGMVSLHLGAMEPRIAAVVIVDIVTSNPYQFDELPGWGDPDSFVPGWAAISSHGELLGMMAPRPVLVMHTDDDVTAPTEVAASEWEIAEAAQRLHDVDRFEGRGFLGLDPAHCWCEPKILATVQFFAEAFGVPAIAATAIPPTGTEGRARPPDGELRWLDLLLARLARPPALPTPRSSSGSAPCRGRDPPSGDPELVPPTAPRPRSSAQRHERPRRSSPRLGPFRHRQLARARRSRRGRRATPRRTTIWPAVPSSATPLTTSPRSPAPLAPRA